MSNKAQFNRYTLSTVKPGLDSTLVVLSELIEKYFNSPESNVDTLEKARAEMHSLVGVLRMVDLNGLATFCSELAALLSDIAANPKHATSTHHDVLLRSITNVTEYINALNNGSIDAALRLFPQYQELQQLRGLEMSFELDLFYPDLAIVLPTEILELPIPVDALSHLKVLRREYQQGLLNWLHEEDSLPSLQQMQQALEAVIRCVPQDGRRAFWWIAASLFECLKQNDLPSELNIRKLLSRIDQQLRSVVEGNASEAISVMNEMLYMIGRSHASSRHIEMIKDAYALEDYLLDQSANTSDETNQLLISIRENLSSTEDSWELCVQGDDSFFQQYHKHLEELSIQIGKLESDDLKELIKKIIELSRHATSPENIRPIAMEMAIALLLVRSGIENYGRLGSGFQEEVKILIKSMEAIENNQPEDLGQLSDLVEHYYELEMRGDVMGSLATEIAANLRNVEQGLISFFKNATKRDGLTEVLRLLAQIQGAFHISSLVQAEDLLSAVENKVGHFSSTNDFPDADEKFAIAEAVSALENYMQHLTHGQSADVWQLEEALQEMIKLDKIPEQKKETASAQEPEVAKEVPLEPRVGRPFLQPGPQQIPPDTFQVGADHKYLHEERPPVLEPLESIEFQPAQIPSANIPPTTEKRQMLEIFLEEAGEVLINIRSKLDACKSYPDDQESLVSIRRGFHTLKGSSKMIGLTDFGEVAWIVESLLNKWLETSNPNTPELLGFIDMALQTFASWVDSLVKTGAASIDATELVKAAKLLDESLKEESNLNIAFTGFPLTSSQKTTEPEVVAPEAITLEAVTPETIEPEVVAPEAITLEAVTPETIEPEVVAPEAITLEAVTPETIEPEVVAPEAITLEAVTPETIEPEVIAPEAITLEAVTPETIEPEVVAPEAITLEAVTPETIEPEVIAPEAITLEAVTPETIEPEVIAPEAITLEAVTPETIEPEVIAPEAITLEAVTPETIEPEVIAPEAITLEAVTPETIEPEVIAPEAITLEAVTPETIEPEVVAPEAITLEAVTPETIEPEVIAPEAITLEAVTPETIEPDKIISGDANMFPGLFKIAIIESNQNTQILREQLESTRNAFPPVVHFDFMRAAHTLASINRNLGFMHAAELASALEGWLAARVGKQFSLNIEQVKMLDQAISLLANMGQQDPDSTSTLVNNLLVDKENLIGYWNVAPESFDEISRKIEVDLQDLPEEENIASEKLKAREITLEQLFADIDLDVTSELPSNQIIESVEPESNTYTNEQIIDFEKGNVEVGLPTSLSAGTDNINQNINISTSTQEDFLHIANSQEIGDIGISNEEIRKGEAEFSTETKSILGSFIKSLDSTIEQVENLQVTDELDEQLLPVYLLEADELIQKIKTDLNAWREAPLDQGMLHSLKRQLHTLKGSSRMVGAMQIGEFAHEMEDLVAATHQAGETGYWDTLEIVFAHIVELLEDLRNGKSGVAEHESVETPRHTSGKRAFPKWGGVERRSQQTSESTQHLGSMLRIRSDVVDRFVNEAGEISVVRSRVETEVRLLKEELLELTASIARMRMQLREVEIQAESQIQARVTQAKDKAESFDPLELDRYTRLQELTRFLNESVHDVQTVQQSIKKQMETISSEILAQGRLSRELQQGLMNVRMVSFNSIADRLYRIVRQTGKELNKRVNLELQGTNVEVDRSVLEKLIAPFEHLLRNSIVHGLESEKQRIEKGKLPFGEIRLSVRQDSNELVFEFSDDGAGLDFSKLRERAIASGHLQADEDVTIEELTQLIFIPGLSTATQISEIAGRGIGMDVVRNEILALDGRIDVSSRSGRGTRFIIHLPLTLAVTQVLMVAAGDRAYAIPSSMIEQVNEMKSTDMEILHRERRIEWQGNSYPLHYLPYMLGNLDAVQKNLPKNSILMLRSGEQRIALHVDELLGNHEVIVKNIGPQLARLSGIAGATVMGNGNVLLILNPLRLVQRTSITKKIKDVIVNPLPTQPLIMVVDDSLTVRKITSRMLLRAGYQVITAKDGLDALEKLQEFNPKVMLLDIEMPRMDGFSLVKQLRRDPKTSELPIIMITSRIADKHREYALQLGVNTYMGKPYQEDDLLQNIADFVAGYK